MDYILIVKHQPFMNENGTWLATITMGEVIYSIPSSSFVWFQKNTATRDKRNKMLVDFYCIQCIFTAPSSCLSGAKLQNKELSASSSVDFHIQAQGLHRWPWRQSLMPSFRKSVTLYALFFLSAVFLSPSKSQSTGLIVEYAFTHHWFLFSLSSATLQLHLPIHCFFQLILLSSIHHSCFVHLLSGTNISPFSGKEAQLETEDVAWIKQCLWVM